ncbi:MAG TPA: histidine phosphatase family protein [Candidatus Cybelea sp.]
MSRTVVLCRHAATEANLSKRFISTSDPPLAAEGRAQCERLREALAPLRFEQCLVSPLRRCLETRERTVPLVPFEIEPALREVDFGSWEGKTLEWLELRAPEMLAQRQRDPVRFRPPGGESFEDAAERLCALAQALRTRDDTLVIGHRVTLGILERLLRDLPLDSPLVEGLQPGEFRIVRG